MPSSAHQSSQKEDNTIFTLTIFGLNSLSVHSGHSTSSEHKAQFSSVRAAFNQIQMCWWCLCYQVFSFYFYFVRSFSSGHVEIITGFPEDVQIAMVTSSGNIVHKTAMMAFSKILV